MTGHARKRSTPSRREVDDVERLASEARNAVARLAIARLSMASYGGRTSPDVDRAVAIMSAALDVIGGDTTATPYAVDRVRCMHTALVTTTYRSVDACVAAGAGNLRRCVPTIRVHMARAFVDGIDIHIRSLGADVRRLAIHDVIATLEKWRKTPKMGAGQLSTRGVVIRLLVLAGVTLERARSRVRRLR